MKHRQVLLIVLGVVPAALAVSIAVAAQGRDALASDSFKPVGSGAGFGRTECHQCHTRVKANDYIFTNYAKR
jgi:hypothetical protein